MTETLKTTQLHVTGMTCGSCVANVTEELEELSGVTNVAVDLNSEGVSVVTVTAKEEISEEDFKTAVTEAGYKLVKVESVETPADTKTKLEQAGGGCGCHCGCK